MKKIFTPHFFVVTTLIALAAVARFFTPIPNFTPIAAIALFGGAYLMRKDVAFLLPVIVLTITNFWLGTFDLISMSAVYVCFILSVALGILIRRKITFGRVIAVSLASSVMFFAVTNFAVWISGFCGYPMTFGGLILCYEMAIPFFRNEILGTLFYSGVLFGVFELSKRHFPILTQVAK